MISESGVFDMESSAAAGCISPGIGLGVTLIGLIAAAVLARKNNKYFWGASAAWQEFFACLGKRQRTGRWDAWCRGEPGASALT